jgi:D-alanyl-D-alanine dipeptidase
VRMTFAKFVLTAAVSCVMIMAVFASASSRSPLSGSRQALIVIASDWSSNTGQLLRYEHVGKEWKRVGDVIPVVLGRNGMAWGAGFQTDLPPGAPVKREGDGRSPAGVFALGPAFGFDAEKPAWLKLAYVPLTSATECVDDRQSSYYNSVVDRVPSVSADWNSSEKMRQIDVYRWGVVVDQNSERSPGAGSCVFLHIWHGADKPTAGCTAMEQPNLEQVMRWLDPSKRPVLVALPESEYERLRRAWGLPPQFR